MQHVLCGNNTYPTLCSNPWLWKSVQFLFGGSCDTKCCSLRKQASAALSRSSFFFVSHTLHASQEKKRRRKWNCNEKVSCKQHAWHSGLQLKTLFYEDNKVRVQCSAQGWNKHAGTNQTSFKLVPRPAKDPQTLFPRWYNLQIHHVQESWVKV